MKKALVTLMLLIILVAMATIHADYKTRELKASDRYIRDRVVMLRGDLGGCSGIEIKAPSGMHYILTARHCQKITNSGIIDATLESGITLKTRILEISKTSDLMLLSPIEEKTIPIAKNISTYEHIHTLTHGNMKPVYRTDGEWLKAETLSFPIGYIDTLEDESKCLAMPGQKVEISFFGRVCTSELKLVMTTAMVVGGSSGGPVLNETGELVGIVTGTTGFFSAITPLDDIKAFLADK